MKAVPIKLTPERKKLAALGVLGLLAVYSIYANFFAGPDVPPSAKQAQKAAPTPEAKTAPRTPAQAGAAGRKPDTAAEATTAGRRGGRSAAQQFRPSLNSGR